MFADVTVQPARKPAQAQNFDFPGLVLGIQQHDQNAMAELYMLMQRGIRYMVQQRMSGREQSVEDRVHEVYVITVRAIREGKVREPEHLAGFVRTVAVRQVCDEIRRAGLDRRRCVATDDDAPLPCQAKNPEDLAIENERRERMARTLRSLRPRDREILRRFYLECQTPAQICEEMGLTETQFRLMKSRAKARLTELGRRSIERTKTA